jgi:hypothetical protein
MYDSDKITAVMTTEPTTKHINSLYTTDNKTHKLSLCNRCRCLLLFSAVAICSTSFMLIKMEATFEMANRK